MRRSKATTTARSPLYLPGLKARVPAGTGDELADDPCALKLLDTIRKRILDMGSNPNDLMSRPTRNCASRPPPRRTVPQSA
jgi:hypothetical protein